jgi:small neutral amino acid transporter SnatA (MarC family)
MSMAVDAVGMPTTFFTPERLDQFWFYVKWFMSYNMPIFMICAACLVAFIVMNMISESANATKEESDKSDDDFDVRHY